jgi:putative transposase
VGIGRSSYAYKSIRPDATLLRHRLRELAASRPRWGYRRLHILLRREGWTMNRKRTYRIYREEQLELRTKRRRKRVSESRLPARVPEAHNELWSIDFMADRLGSGEKFRTFDAIDGATRQCVGIAVERSFPSRLVTAYLDRWISEHGKPSGILLDNGTEFTANVFDAWAYERQIALHFITPGRPTENSFIESFNGKLRDECLNTNWFETIDQAREEIESWRTDYNEARPHSSLGAIPPAQYVAEMASWRA